jgi:hypothetical protein
MLLEVAEEDHLGSVNKQLPAFVADFVRKTVRSAGTLSFMHPWEKEVVEVRELVKENSVNSGS